MDNPNYRLEGVIRDKDEMLDFEGPLSLILMLLSKNKIEIRDLKIADILEQYLDYLARMQSMDLEIASEFVQMASHLLYIKTQMLLSSDEEPSELELLLQSLEQLKARDALSAIQQITPQLKAASEKGLQRYVKQPEPLPRAAGEYRYRHESIDLLRALWHLYSRGSKAPETSYGIPAVPSRIVYSVRDKSRELVARLEKKSATLGELYSACSSRSEVVATFVAVLELCSMGSLLLTRSDGDYRVDFVGGSVEDILEKIVE